MFAARRLLRKKKEQTDNRPTLILIVIGLMFVIVVAIRFWDWTSQTQRSLLPNIPELTLLEDLSVIQDIVPLPTQTYGSELFMAALYSYSHDEFPQGTIRTVYIKDNWRFVEIDYLPGTTSQEYLATHIYPTQEVLLDQETPIWIQTIDAQTRCIDYDDGIPNRCEISRHLIAELPEKLLLIAADGEHATDGELIEITRSIINQ